MPAEPVLTVTFEIDLPGGETVGEANLASRRDDVRRAFLSPRSPEGGLTISNAADGTRTELGDVAESLVLSLCLEGVEPLANGRPFTRRSMTADESLTLTPKGDRIEVAGDAVRSASYPRRDLLAALADCGGRFVKLLHDIHGDRPEWEGRLRMLRSKAESARTAAAAGA